MRLLIALFFAILSGPVFGQGALQLQGTLQPGDCLVGIASNLVTSNGNCANIPPSQGPYSGIQGGTTFPISAIETGSGNIAHFWLNFVGVATSPTIPEIAAQLSVSSNVGSGNPTTAYKIALALDNIGGSGSSSMYGLTNVVRASAGLGVASLYVQELDPQNGGATSTSFGSAGEAIAAQAISDGAFGNSAAFVASSGNSNFFFGFGTKGTINTPFYAAGTHVNGLDVSSATISGFQIKASGFTVDPVGNTFIGATDVSANLGSLSRRLGTVSTFTLNGIGTAASLLSTSVSMTNGAGVSLGTLATAPTAGNPTKWLGINDNGTVRYVPAW